MISFDELQSAFKSLNSGSVPTNKRLQTIMNNVDYQGNGKINYSEFLAATVSVRAVLTQEKLYALFKHFDTDNSEYITPENIAEAFYQNGKELSEVQTKQIMQDHDLMGDGRLSFSEFRAIFFENDIEMSSAINSASTVSMSAVQSGTFSPVKSAPDHELLSRI